MLKLFQVSPAEIDLAWKQGADKLAEATKRAAREITASQLKMILSRGERTLIGVRDEGGPPLGWAVIGIHQLPNIRTLYVFDIYAPGATGPEAFNLLKQYAKANGCSVIRGSCDDAVGRLWERKMQATKVYSVYEIEVES